MAKKSGCLVAVVAVLAIGAIGSAIGGGSDDKPKKVETAVSTEAKNDDTEEKEEEQKVFAVGDSVESKDITITLVSATESAGTDIIKPDDGKEFLILNFDIQNNSKSDINISSVTCFEAYCDDYSLNQDIIGLQAPEAKDQGQLDGSVAAGKKMNGVIVYQVPTDFKKFEIKVSPGFWSLKDIEFAINK